MTSTITATSQQQVLLIIALCLCSLFSSISSAQCRDFDAIAAANKKALSFFKNGEVFHPAVIQKVHNPSGKKEVASYIKVGEKRYSIFNLVDENCKVKFRKRTRQGD
jgi:hypothetical protein